MSLLEEAIKLVDGERMEQYGHPRVNYDKLKPLWNGILGVEVTDAQIAFCLIALKMARHLTNPKHDNLVDIAGYARVLELVEEYRGNRGKYEGGAHTTDS